MPPVVALGEPGGRQGGDAGFSLIESFQGGDMLALPACAPMFERVIQVRVQMIEI